MKNDVAFAPYEIADYLETPEYAALYLEAAFEEADDDPSVVTMALGTIARSGNMSELARRIGMSRERIYKALSEEGNPSFSTVMKITNGLGIIRRVFYFATEPRAQ